MSDAPSQVQESWGAVEHTEDCPAERDPCTCGGYVPLSVAERLAEALEHLPGTYLTAFAAGRLVDYREAYPREETTG